MEIVPTTKRDAWLEEFPAKEGAYFLERGRGEPAIYFFDFPVILNTRSHITRKKLSQNALRPLDAGRMEETQGLRLDNFSGVATRKEGYVFPTRGTTFCAADANDGEVREASV